MLSQVALNSNLKSPFCFHKFKSNKDLVYGAKEEICQQFENGKVVILEGLKPQALEFFLNLPKVFFQDWVPPVFDSKIRQPANSNHPLWPFYKDADLILQFKENLNTFQRSWEEIHFDLFDRYTFSDNMWSWRMNSMDKGFLHLDIPESNFPEHQMRTFINLSERPRIIEFGPTLQEMVKNFISDDDLKAFIDLPNDVFIEKIKTNWLKKENFEDLYLPRHVLSLAPGAVWIGNAFLITHGLIFGEKTVCLESRIQVDSLSNPQKNFHKICESIKHGLQSSNF